MSMMNLKILCFQVLLPLLLSLTANKKGPYTFFCFEMQDDIEMTHFLITVFGIEPKLIHMMFLIQ